MTRRNFAPLVLALLILVATVAVSTQAQTTIKVHLQNSLDTGKVRAGDTFTGTLAEPLIIDGRQVAGRGALVTGRVEAVVPSGRLKTPAEIRLSLLTVHARRREVPVDTGDLTIKAGSHKKRNLVMIGGGAAAGTIIGGILGGKKGAVIGGMIGAGAGTTGAFLTGKKQIVLPPETLLVFETDSILMGTKELADLQSARQSGTGTRAAAESRDEREEREPAYSRRRDEDYDEDRHEHHEGEEREEREDRYYRDARGERYEGPYPEEMEIDMRGGYANVHIHWADGSQQIRVPGNDFNRVLSVISRRTGLPPGWLKRNLRADGKKFKFKSNRGVRDHGKGIGRGKGKGKGKGKKKN